MISFNQRAVLIDTPKYQQGILGFVVVAVGGLYKAVVQLES